MEKSSLESMWEDFWFPPETFTSSYLQRYMQSAVPSTMSQGPASLYKQAQRAGKPLNLSSPIACTVVDRWRGSCRPQWKHSACTGTGSAAAHGGPPGFAGQMWKHSCNVCSSMDPGVGAKGPRCLDGFSWAELVVLRSRVFQALLPS